MKIEDFGLVVGSDPLNLNRLDLTPPRLGLTLNLAGPNTTYSVREGV